MSPRERQAGLHPLWSILGQNAPKPGTADRRHLQTQLSSKFPGLGQSGQEGWRRLPGRRQAKPISRAVVRSVGRCCPLVVSGDADRHSTGS